MSDIKFYCRYCGQQQIVSAEMAGNIVYCTSCGNKLSVPDPGLSPKEATAGNIQTFGSNHLDVTQVILSQDRFSPVPNENILIDGLVTYIKSTINVMTTHAYLTNYRLAICNTGMLGAQVLFGPIGAAVALAKKPTKITVQVPIAEITSIVNGKHGFATKYTVYTRSGEHYDLQFTKIEQWQSAFSALGVMMN